MELSYRPPREENRTTTETSYQLRACRSIYENLPVDESRTRVLVLHSNASHTAPVSCSLEVIILDPQPSKTYTALSYVWGDASVTEDILVNGVSFAVAFNLASALRQIRKSFGKLEDVILWADAICTNVGNTA